MAAPPLEGIGPASLIPTLKLDGALPALTPEEGFLLSRVDGRTALGDLCLLVPFPRAQTVAMLRRLWQSGVLAIAGLTPPNVETPKAQAPNAVEPAPAADLVTVTPPASESGLTAEQRRRIDAYFASLDQRDAFSLLEIDRTADDKTIRRAYFKLSKEFHPDRFFGKALGEYNERVAAIFRAIKSAHDLLGDKDRRAAYLESLS